MEEKEFLHVHEEVIAKVQEKMPEEERLYQLSEFYKVFGDITRVKILFVLLQGEVCVYDIACLLDMTQSAISHQLRILKQMQLVTYRREGKTMFYSLADDHIENILRLGMEHICE